VPSLVLLRNTPLGLAKFRFFAPALGALRDVDPLRDVLMLDQFGRLIYTALPRHAPCRSCRPRCAPIPVYMNMRLARLQLATSILPPEARVRTTN
jgi:hypothetical protein